MKKILIANIFGIGDVIFTTPLMANLKKGIEGVTIDYLCNARTKDIIETDPEVDEIFVYEKDEYTRLWRSSKKKFFVSAYLFFRDIRRKRYDVVFDFTLSRKFGLLFMLAGIPVRVGLDYKGRGTFLNRKEKFNGFEARHVIEYYLDLLKYAGVDGSFRGSEIVPDENLLEWGKSYLKQKGMDDTALTVIIPGGGASWGPEAGRKRWSAERFAELADILVERSVPVAIIGNSEERSLCREVAGRMRNKPVFIENDLDLKKYIALLSRCALVVCNDGGPLHIAVALGVRTVSVYGPVDERVYGPYPPSGMHKVITAGETSCRPCYRRFKLPKCLNDNICLGGIDPHSVADACVEQLKG